MTSPGPSANSPPAVDSGGVDVVHGHSSHHPKGIEVYRGSQSSTAAALLNDYEGSANESFRPELG